MSHNGHHVSYNDHHVSHHGHRVSHHGHRVSCHGPSCVPVQEYVVVVSHRVSEGLHYLWEQFPVPNNLRDLVSWEKYYPALLQSSLAQLK